MLYEIIANKWGKKSFFAWDKEKKYPNFETIDEVSIVKDFSNMNDAYLWLIENLPEYSIGAGIYSKENSDFLCVPGKGFYLINHPEWTDNDIINFIKNSLKEG